MNRRRLRLAMILILAVPAALLFILFPDWQIEHPADAGLVLRSERHLLWHSPAHAHLDAAAIWIPVLAIAIIACALVVLVMNE
jgi:hypothetical protein